MNMPAKNFKPWAPNTVTMLALACGVTSMHMSLWGHWQMAVVYILFSGLFDFLDGKVARALGVSSRFGAELDSLSDFVSFGVAPGFLMYNWVMDPALRCAAFTSETIRQEAIGMHWVAVLFLAVCCASRLARFNSMLDEEQPKYWEHFFMGVPAPAGGMLSMTPLILWLALSKLDCDTSWLREGWLVTCFVVFAGIMMASKIPTFCLKHLHLGHVGRTIVPLIVLALIAGAVSAPWPTMSVVLVCYLISIPVGIFFFLKWRRETPAEEQATDHDKQA